MLSEFDRKTLSDAGITDIDQLARTAAVFLRSHPLPSTEPSSNPLSSQEAAFLQTSGACGVANPVDTAHHQNAMILAAEYAQMVVTAFSHNSKLMKFHGE